MTAKPQSRVLVVDDEANIRRLLRAILKRMPKYDIHVEESESAEAAVKSLEKQRFDLIITDYRMSGRTGVDLLEFAHKACPQTGRMLITAFGELDIGVEAINRGRVDGFMRKPWEHANLIALVDSLLAARVSGPSGHATAPASSRVPRPAPTPREATRSGAPPERPPATRPAPRPGDKERETISQELMDIDRSIRQLRVRLGLGAISPEGYQRANTELTARKAELEVKLMKLDA